MSSGFQRKIRNFSKGLVRIAFESGQRVGINITPKHFYSAIPDIGALRETHHWRQAYDMVGLSGASFADQAKALTDMCRDIDPESWVGLDVHARASAENGQGGGYGVIEAEVLNAFVRRHRPRKIVQIGCGVSTSVMLRAASMVNYMPEVVCVEPFPSAYLKRAS